MARKSMSSLPSTTPVQIGSVAKANCVLGSSIGYAQQSSYHSDDENVDLKAASYIYSVRQRLRSLEGVGSDQAYHP
ncbi:hypothetical protein NL676_032629 [Syzygium grande]|nr:hypothetical protein NL676_032629 [Syzygium grande]